MAFWSTLFSTKKEPAAPPSSADLRTQVYRADCTAIQVLDRTNRGDFVVRALAPGLVEALVEEHEDGESIVRRERVQAFGKSDDELFALGAAQGASLTDVQKIDLEHRVQVFASNDFYLSAKLLRSFARGKHAYGVLFAPISWHHWCVHIVQASTVPPLVAMISMVARDAQEKMQVAEYEALTGDVYWYKPDGIIEKLELVGSGADVRATSPELQQAMDAAFRKHVDAVR